MNWKDDLKNNLGIGIGSFDFDSLIVDDRYDKKPYLMFFNPAITHTLKSPYSFIILKTKFHRNITIISYIIRDNRTDSEIQKDSGFRFIVGTKKQLNFRAFKLLPDTSILTDKEKTIIKKL